jgi:hypothetical protein
MAEAIAEQDDEIETRLAETKLEPSQLFERRMSIIKQTERFAPVERIYLILRGMIEHEDNLINNRNTWFISLNSFLFGSISLLMTSNVWIAPAGTKSVSLSVESLILAMLFSLVGLISCYSTYISVRAAYNAIRALEKHWTYSFEPTIYGFSTGKKHHLDEDMRFTSASNEKLAYDPIVIFPFIVGGGPFKKSVYRGKVSSFGVIAGVAFLWFVVSIYSGYRLLGSVVG